MKKASNAETETTPLLPVSVGIASTSHAGKSQEEQEDEIWAQEHHMSSIGKVLEYYHTFSLIFPNNSFFYLSLLISLWIPFQALL